MKERQSWDAQPHATTGCLAVHLPGPHLGGKQRHGDGERDADCAVEVQDSDGLELCREGAAQHAQASRVVRRCSSEHTNTRSRNQHDRGQLSKKSVGKIT